MLKSVVLGNWKSFGDDARVPLGRLTLLVGANASGKSNFLDALRFLQGIALDLPVGEVLRGRWEGGRELWPGIRGGAHEAARTGHAAFTITTTWDFTPTQTIPFKIYNYGIQVATEREPVVDAECLVESASGSYLFDTHAASLRGNTGREAGDAIRVALRGQGKGNSPTPTYSARRSLLGQLEPRKRVADEVLEIAHQVQASLRGATFLDIQPSRMRGYVPATSAPLASSGENLSAVLAHLCEDPRQKEDIVDWISELCEPDVENIEFVRTELQDVMLQLVERGGQKISARSLSDGTLRFLGELVALMTAPEGSMLLLEEPDVGLHPPRIHLLAQLLESFTQKRNIQVIAATHSPTLLEHLGKAALADVVAFTRGEDGATSAHRLGDTPHFDVLEAKGDFGRLFSTGWLEQAL